MTLLDFGYRKTVFALAKSGFFEMPTLSQEHFGPFTLSVYQTRLHLQQGVSDTFARGSSLKGPNMALRKMLGESIERHSLFAFCPISILTATHQHLEGQGIDPAAYVGSSASPDVMRRINLEWVLGTSLTDGKPLRIPLQPHSLKKRSGKHLLRPSSSVGGAVELTLGRAIRNGILELLERDAYSKMLIGGGLICEIQYESQKELRVLSEALNSRGLSVRYFLLPSRLRVFSILTLITRKETTGAAFAMGLKSDTHDLQAAMLGATEEGLASLLEIDNLLREGTRLQGYRKKALEWQQRGLLEKRVPFLFNSKRLPFSEIEAWVKTHQWPKSTDMLLEEFRDEKLHLAFFNNKSVPVPFFHSVMVCGPQLLPPTPYLFPTPDVRAYANREMDRLQIKVDPTYTFDYELGDPFF